MQALDSIPRIAGEFADAFGRESGGLVRTYRADDAETIVVALGSVLGTIEDVVDELRERGTSIGALGVKCFRPYPLEEVREALSHAKRIVVIEKAFAVGAGGIVGQNVRLALSGLPVAGPRRGRGPRRTGDHEGLAARAVRRRARGPPRARAACTSSTSTPTSSSASSSARRSGRAGPHEENILRDLGIVAGRSH